MKKFLIYLSSFLILFGVSVAFAEVYIEDFQDEIFDPELWYVDGDYVITADEKLYMYGNTSEFGFFKDEYIYRIEAEIKASPEKDQSVGMEAWWVPENGEPLIDFSIYLYTSGYFSPGPEFVAHKEEDPLPSHSLGPAETDRWYHISITLFDNYAQYEIDGTKHELFQGSFVKPDRILQNIAYVHGVPRDPLDNVDHYTDNVKVYTSTCLSVSIDVKPGSYPNCINSNGHGAIPVAILSSVDFDATQVDPTTVSLDGQEVRIVGKGNTQAHIEDANNDGFDDLVVQIEDVDGTYQAGDTLATLTAETFDGMSIVGTDTLCIVP